MFSQFWCQSFELLVHKWQMHTVCMADYTTPTGDSIVSVCQPVK